MKERLEYEYRTKNTRINRWYMVLINILSVMLDSVGLSSQYSIRNLELRVHQICTIFNNWTIIIAEKFSVNSRLPSQIIYYFIMSQIIYYFIMCHEVYRKNSYINIFLNLFSKLKFNSNYYPPNYMSRAYFIFDIKILKICIAI